MTAVVCVFVMLTAAAGAETKRGWQQGNWRDANQTIAATNAGIVTGTSFSGCTIAPGGGSSLGDQVCAIETADAYYFARRPFGFRGRDAVSVSVDKPVRFAVDKSTVYVIGDDGKEHKFELVKKIQKTGTRN